MAQAEVSSTKTGRLLGNHNTNIMSKIALITGANKGIGLETARQLARDHNFTVLVGARDKTRGDEAVGELKSAGFDAQLLLLDPTDAESVQKAAAQVEAEFGHLDVLINNAGTGSKEDGPLIELDALREIYDLNVFGLHAVTRAFWPLLEKSDAARLVNVSSILGSLTLFKNGEFGDHNALAYDSSKAAVNMMTLHYAQKWKDTPHRANTIHPGSVVTDLNPGGEIPVEKGAASSVEMATIPNDGPNGTFTHLGETLPW